MMVRTQQDKVFFRVIASVTVLMINLKRRLAGCRVYFTPAADRALALIFLPDVAPHIAGSIFIRGASIDDAGFPLVDIGLEALLLPALPAAVFSDTPIPNISADCARRWRGSLEIDAMHLLPVPDIGLRTFHHVRNRALAHADGFHPLKVGFRDHAPL